MTDINKMKINELKATARELKIKGWWDMKKVELIEAIQINQPETETSPEASEETVKEETTVITEETEKDDTDEPEKPETTSKKKHRGNLIEYNGKSQNLESWAKELGFRPQTLYGRIYVSGWTVERAFTTPSKGKKVTTDES